MCGITGVISKQQIDLDAYYRAHALLKHRGPDDEGFVILDEGRFRPISSERTHEQLKSQYPFLNSNLNTFFIFGHHRLSILDLSAASHQPMISSCGNITLSYNGEIYNYIELRQELESVGHVFKTTGDAEVVLKSFEQWGVNCFKRFNGMWAIALYDLQKKELYLCRDRFGIKPLYYRITKDEVAFASETKFFRSYNADNQLNIKRAYEYLNSCWIDHSTEDFFLGVKLVQPGTLISINYEGILKQSSYWKVHSCDEERETYIERVNHLRSLLESSIDLRLRSDVEVGTLLSGGLDSTAIVSLISSKNAHPLNSFSAVFNEKEYSEDSYINETLNKYGNIKGHEIYPDPKKLKNEIEDLIRVQEVPFRSLAVYSQYCIYRYIKSESDVVVLLNGQGSDEIFGGYTSHYDYKNLSLLLKGDLKGVGRELDSLKKYRGISAKRMMKGMALAFMNINLPSRFRNNLGINHLGTSFKGMDYKDKLYRKQPLNYILKRNLLFSALPEYLHYEDRNSMAFSLESRLPFLDYRIVEYAFGLSCEDKIDHGINKKILRDSVKDCVPEMILSRKDKMGFVSPQELWQTTVLKKQIESTVFDGSGVLDISHARLQRANLDWTTLWRIYCLKMWQSQSF